MFITVQHTVSVENSPGGGEFSTTSILNESPQSPGPIGHRSRHKVFQVAIELTRQPSFATHKQEGGRLGIHLSLLGAAVPAACQMP